MQKLDPGLTDENGEPTSWERKVRQSPIKSKKVKDLMRSKSSSIVMQQLGSAIESTAAKN